MAFWPFMWRRAWRILPPYYGALACSAALIMLVPALADPSIREWHKSFPAFGTGSVCLTSCSCTTTFPPISTDRPPALEHRHRMADLLPLPSAPLDREAARRLQHRRDGWGHHDGAEPVSPVLLAAAQPVAAAIRWPVRVRHGVRCVELPGRRRLRLTPNDGAGRRSCCSARGRWRASSSSDSSTAAAGPAGRRRHRVRDGVPHQRGVDGLTASCLRVLERPSLVALGHFSSSLYLCTRRCWRCSICWPAV